MANTVERPCEITENYEGGAISYQSVRAVEVFRTCASVLPTRRQSVTRLSLSLPLPHTLTGSDDRLARGHVVGALSMAEAALEKEAGGPEETI